MKNMNSVNIDETSKGRIRATLIGSLPPMKGISQYCLALCNALSDIADVDFFSFKKLYPEFLYPGGRDKDDSYSDYTVKCDRRNTLHGYNPLTWVKAALACKGDVIHVQWWSYVLFPAYFTMLTLLRIRRKKVVMTVHNVLPHEHATAGRIFTQILLNLVDGVIVHSDSNKNAFLETYSGVGRKKLFIIPHGVLSVPTTNLTPEEARSKLGMDLRGRVLLFFGNIRPYKGLNILLTSLKEIVHRFPDTTLLIAGQSWNDWKEYEDQIRGMDLTRNVTARTSFVHMEDIPLFFLSADIVVLPYLDFEAQSGVGLMALNYGKPLVVTRVGGLDELIEDAIAAVEPANPAKLAESINTILGDPTLLERMSESSTKMAAKFQWPGIARLTIEAYTDVLKANLENDDSPPRIITGKD